MRTDRKSSANLPARAAVYVGATIVAGAATVALRLPVTSFGDPLLFLALLILSAATSAMKVHLPLIGGASTMSVSHAIDFASLILLGPDKTMIVAAVSAFSQCYVNRKERSPAYRTAFSMASLVLTVQAAGAVFRLLGGDPGTFTNVSDLARPLAGAATVYFLLNTGLVASAIALSSRQPIGQVWNASFLWSAPSYFVGAAAAAAIAALVTRTGYWLAPFAFAPLYLTYRAYKVYMGRIDDEQRHVRQTSDLHLATIEALARAIDAKDRTATTHIRRVQLYAAALAERIGLSEGDIQGVKTASLLHDIGKLAVPEHILSKSGPLTQEEFQKIRIHPQVGAEIIAAVPFPYPVAPIVLGHHERWDGKGYPHGLAGEDIPIGARILTIVDYYDAITTERPYHRALSHDGAVGLLRHEAGRALDPSLVPAFIELLPGLRAEVEEAERQQAPAVAFEPEAAGTASAGPDPESMSANAFENIALAHREIYALYEIAQAMGTSLGVRDTMALVSSKLANIIPWTGCALNLYDAGLDTLTCRFAAGAETPALLNRTVRSGEGLSGWVAHNRRTLVNADPRPAFEAAGLPAPATLRSAIICPLYFNDTFIGTLELFHEDRDRYSEDHRRLIERVAEQAGAVIHNSLVFEQTQEDSLTDALTGLPNRRSLFMHLNRELSRAGRLHHRLSLIVVDVDRFKAINDTYGHHVGDRALRSVAHALQSALRPYDLCVRYAGDEFIVVLSDCNRDAAEAKRRELQAKISEVDIEVRADQRITLGASAGVAVFPDDGETYERLLADADHRMYRDKASRHSHLALVSRRATDESAAGDYRCFEPSEPSLSRSAG